MFPIFRISLFGLFFLQGIAFAQVSSKPHHLMLEEAKQHFQTGKWDPAEVVYLKVTQSPTVEERIQAYHGLQELYTKLRLFKKAKKAEIRLQEEKRFKEKLVPKQDKYYSAYTVKKGDTYAKIAHRLQLSQKWLREVNQDKLLIIGDVIRIPKIPYQLSVDKSQKVLVWKRGDEVLKTYRIAIGAKETETPEGEFQVTNKIKNPVWYRLKQVYPPDSPKNLLGTRWLGLNKKGYGIHGTRTPASIGFASSHGCVRMFNHDLEELFEWVPIGTKVTIASSANKN